MNVGKCSVCGHVAPLGADDRCEVCLYDDKTFTDDEVKA